MLVRVHARRLRGRRPTRSCSLAAVGIGATAPQVAPMSRSRLVTMIRDRMPESRARPHALGHHGVRVGGGRDRVRLRPVPRRHPRLGARSVGAARRSGRSHRGVRRRLRPAPERASRLASTAASTARRRRRSPELFTPQLLIVVLGILGVGMFFGTMLTALTSFMADRGAPEQAGLLYGVMGVGSAHPRARRRLAARARSRCGRGGSCSPASCSAEALLLAASSTPRR